MDFSQTLEQALLLDSVDKFMARNLPPEEVLRRDIEEDPPNHLLPRMAEMGLLALPVPEKSGGAGGNWETTALVQERLGYHATMAAIIYNRVVCFGVMTLLNSASSAQCKSFLPELLAGKGTFALALTEPGAGSDAAAISTRAERVCDGWSITGRKVWISGARDALRLVVAARSQTGSRGRSGVSLFLVPPESAGLTMTILSKVGNRCSLSYDIGFDRVTVPFEAIVGEEGGGFEELQRTLFFARSGLSAAAIGTAQAAVDTAANHAKKRIQFNQPIGSFQALAHRLAKMQTEVDKSRLLAYRLASGIDNGEDCTRLASQAKWSATETLKYVTEEGMQIMASAGYSTESPMQRYWRDARLYTFGEGSSELQLDLIAYNMGLGRALKR